MIELERRDGELQNLTKPQIDEIYTQLYKTEFSGYNAAIRRQVENEFKKGLRSDSNPNAPLDIRGLAAILKKRGMNTDSISLKDLKGTEARILFEEAIKRAKTLNK